MTTPQLNQTTGAQFTRIYALGAARGENVVPNADIVEPINSSDEWIQQRTGVITRRRAGKDVKVAERVGANPAAAYDISAACAGFTYGIAQADSFVKSGLAEYVLVVGAEKLSDVIDPTDRTISFLLADGAGAAIVGPAESAGIGPTVWGSDGSKWDAIGMTNTMAEYREGAGEVPWPTLRQEGQTVFRWAVWEMAKVAKQALERAGVTADQLAAFVPHQANMRIIDEFAKQLGLPESVVIGRDIATTGNTSAASIPLATHRLLDEHPELSGGLALQIGFGAGLVFGAQVVVLP
jgi:3-oxoacyl-[acyl-carrier-protein] synthase-3